MSTYSHPSQVSAAAPLKDNRKKYTFTLTFTSERPIRPFSNADFLQNRFAYIQYLKGKCGITLEGRQAHICHRRDICIKEIWGRWVLTAMSSKDFKLAFIVIEKFKFPQGSLKKAAHQTSELWKATLTKGLIPGGYVLKVVFGEYHMLKSIEFWPKYQAKQFRTFLIFENAVPICHRVTCTWSFRNKGACVATVSNGFCWRHTAAFPRCISTKQTWLWRAASCRPSRRTRASASRYSPAPAAWSSKGEMWYCNSCRLETAQCKFVRSQTTPQALCTML